jgi:hypothetical protein
LVLKVLSRKECLAYLDDIIVLGKDFGEHLENVDKVKNLVQLFFFGFLCLTPFSAISWRPVLVVEEAGVPGENH